MDSAIVNYSKTSAFKKLKGIIHIYIYIYIYYPRFSRICKLGEHLNQFLELFVCLA